MLSLMVPKCLLHQQLLYKSVQSVKCVLKTRLSAATELSGPAPLRHRSGFRLKRRQGLTFIMISIEASSMNKNYTTLASHAHGSEHGASSIARSDQPITYPSPGVHSAVGLVTCGSQKKIRFSTGQPGHFPYSVSRPVWWKMTASKRRPFLVHVVFSHFGHPNHLFCIRAPLLPPKFSSRLAARAPSPPTRPLSRSA